MEVETPTPPRASMTCGTTWVQALTSCPTCITLPTITQNAPFHSWKQQASAAAQGWPVASQKVPMPQKIPARKGVPIKTEVLTVSRTERGRAGLNGAGVNRGGADGGGAAGKHGA